MAESVWNNGTICFTSSWMEKVDVPLVVVQVMEEVEDWLDVEELVCEVDVEDEVDSEVEVVVMLEVEEVVCEVDV
jgi:hypothetical protein